MSPMSNIEIEIEIEIGIEIGFFKSFTLKHLTT